MQILLARHAGFCPGVRRAVEMAREAGLTGRKVATLGPLVHNEVVVARLRDEGINSVEYSSELPEGILVIRSHGVEPSVINEAAANGRDIIDATCPFVKKVQTQAEALSEQGYQIIIIGDSRHPEVKGILGWTRGNGIAVSVIEDLEKIESDRSIAVVSQTTASVEDFKRITAAVKAKWPSAKVINTICNTTIQRQKEAAEIASRSNLVLVVGSKRSSNTGKLAQIASHYAPTKIVACAGEISPDWCKGIGTVGILAGASTADWTIREVVAKMDELEKNEKKEQGELNPEDEQNTEGQAENPEEVEMEAEEESTETAEEEPEKETEEEPASAVEGKEAEEVQSAEDVISGDVDQPQVNQVVTGKIIQVNDNEVLVDIGAKTEAVLPKNQVYLEEGQELSDVFSPDAQIEVLVIKESSAEGNVIVSAKRLEKEKRWEELTDALEKEITLTGIVKEVVPAGLIFDLGYGFRGFMPGSLFDVRFVPDFSIYVGQELSFKVIELNKSKNKIILSRKLVIDEELQQTKQETLEKLKPREVITGVVKRLTGFGAFVDVGGIDGLVHVSEISWGRTDKPSDVLSVGQEIQVRVLDIDKDRERISLSIRKVKDDPWTTVDGKYAPEQIITGTITRLVNFGAFVEIEPGIEGLVHVSEIADYHVNQPSDILTEGEEVQVKILAVSADEQRISLSMREAKPGRRERKNNGNNPPPAPEKSDGNSGVTLGDVFGDLFEDKNYK